MGWVGWLSWLIFFHMEKKNLENMYLLLNKLCDKLFGWNSLIRFTHSQERIKTNKKFTIFKVILPGFVENTN